MDEQVTAKQWQKFKWGLSAWMVALFLLGLALAWDFVIFPKGIDVSLTRVALQGASLILMFVGLYFGIPTGFMDADLRDQVKAIRRRAWPISTFGGITSALAIYFFRVSLSDFDAFQIFGAICFGVGIWSLIFLVYQLRAYSAADLPSEPSVG